MKKYKLPKPVLRFSLAAKQILPVCDVMVALVARKRWRRQMPQRVLAEKARISKSMLSYVESLQRTPTLNVLERICMALGYEAWKLMRAAQRAVRWWRSRRRRISRQARQKFTMVNFPSVRPRPIASTWQHRSHGMQKSTESRSPGTPRT